MTNAITVSLKGSATTDVSDILVSMTVEHELNKIPYAQIELATGNFADREYPIYDEADFKIGEELEILIRYENDGAADTSIFKGVVTAVKFEAKEGLPIAVLIVKDPAFRLVNSVNTELFSKKNDKQMIESVLANQSGLSLAKSEASLAGVTFEQYVKMQSSDWDFVLERSSEYGAVISLDNGAMTSTILSDMVGELELEIGINDIVDINLEENADRLNDEIEIAYWDVKTKPLN